MLFYMLRYPAQQQNLLAGLVEVEAVLRLVSGVWKYVCLISVLIFNW